MYTTKRKIPTAEFPALSSPPLLPGKPVFYNRLLLLVAGLGGLLYGVDLGIIAGALPYLEATSGLNAGQLSIVVAAVLLGSVISTLFAGLFADSIGRKPVMALSGVLFVISIPTIALAHGYGPLFIGRLLQGVSAGLIGVVVPLYLAECLVASSRGKGTGIFQWLLTLGIVAAALVGMFFSFRVAQVAAQGDPVRLLAFKDAAWRGIFWVSLPPGILFVIGTLLVEESPRWLFRQGRNDAAYAALLRSRSTEQADRELKEMVEVSTAERGGAATGSERKEPLWQRKYIIPFVLACVILACTQATGVNSIIAYNINILSQSGLSDVAAHWGYVVFTIVNFVMTFVGVTLVDRKGRKFLLRLGTAGIMASLICAGTLFLSSERQRADLKDAVQPMVTSRQELTLRYNEEQADRLLGRTASSAKSEAARPTSLVVIYSYGDFRGATEVVRSDDVAAHPIEIRRESCVPSNNVVAFFTNPFANLELSRTTDLRIRMRSSALCRMRVMAGWSRSLCWCSCRSTLSVRECACGWHFRN